MERRRGSDDGTINLIDDFPRVADSAEVELLNEFLLNERLGIANRDQFNCGVCLEQFSVNLA
jgi:hypothetical protein